MKRNVGVPLELTRTPIQGKRGEFGRIEKPDKDLSLLLMTMSSLLSPTMTSSSSSWSWAAVAVIFCKSGKVLLSKLKSIGLEDGMAPISGDYLIKKSLLKGMILAALLSLARIQSDYLP